MANAVSATLLNAKDRKFENLESNVVLGDEGDKKNNRGERPSYNSSLGRATFGTNASWTA